MKTMMFICLLTISLHAQTGNQEKPRFEVISIKPGDKKGHLSDASFQPGGRFRAINVSLHGLIAQYYKMPYAQVIGGPKFIDEDPWDIEAAPEEGKYPLKNGLLDPDLAKLMVQSMLEDRFKLKVHQETRILPGYELVLAKGGPALAPPKDYTASPLLVGGSLSRTKDPTKHAPAIVTTAGLWVPNITLQRFAESLSFFFMGEKRINVVDKTGLEGPFDIQLTWTPRKGGASIASHNQASGDTETTIFDAIQEQLGLKLVPAKVTVPVLVVDDAQMPATN
jgi:uncharacterized protein (TIGR03435 family)